MGAISRGAAWAVNEFALYETVDDGVRWRTITPPGMVDPIGHIGHQNAVMRMDSQDLDFEHLDEALQSRHIFADAMTGCHPPFHLHRTLQHPRRLPPTRCESRRPHAPFR